MTYEQWYEKYVKGKPTVEAKEKAVKNQAADKRQFEEYKEYIRMKYQTLLRTSKT